ncbi:unnamed protein product [Oppiella nova]|uniref:Uncharacterized protein n=1 Tax=Oppiella nova TaxID=334625 RepID=A0A7R9QZF6_9ACAR|nr:unnamed protein product [Oppiella nova]CAG2179805.1 unnamed protein product [Oppiella nova]
MSDGISDKSDVLIAIKARDQRTDSHPSRERSQSSPTDIRSSGSPLRRETMALVNVSDESSPTAPTQETDTSLTSESTPEMSTNSSVNDTNPTMASNTIIRPKRMAAKSAPPIDTYSGSSDDGLPEDNVRNDKNYLVSKSTNIGTNKG